MNDQENDPYLSEEYQFLEEPELNTSENTNTSEKMPKDKPRFDMTGLMTFLKQNSPARNALIVLAVIIGLIILYQFTSSLLSRSQKKIVETQQAQPVQSTPILKAEAFLPKQEVTSTDTDIKAKLSALDSKETNMQAQVSALSNQVSGLNTNLNTLLDKMNQLNQQVADMASKMQDQANTIMLLRERAKPPTPPVVMKRVIPNHMPSMRYYVEAVIPGRAWLIAVNGSTLTVRVGSNVPGYGVVRAIDAVQGRVLMNSGQVIRFSQDDS